MYRIPRVRCVWVAFVCCCFAGDCVLELVCRVRFARVSCPWFFGESPLHFTGTAHDERLADATLMFSSILRRALAAPVARAVARSPLAFAAAGTVSSLAAYAAAPMQCEPAPVTALAGEPGTKRERTLILVKPDGVERGVVGAVISKFESKGYK